MPRLFDAYVMVDWSAASAAKVGKDSVWIGVMKRDIRFRHVFDAINAPTRAQGEAKLREVLADLRRRGERVLIGLDFPLGFPEGTVDRLELKQPDWRGLWSFMASNVVDKADNTNNRFAVAAKMNRLMTNEARPFWGAPAKDSQRWLATTKPAEHGADLPPLLRRTDRVIQAEAKGAPRTVWQLMGAGTVGGHAIMGIAAAKRLADQLGDKALVWPFSTGWKAPETSGIEAVIAEVHSSLAPGRPEPGEIADRAQVRALCEHFARLDDQNKLAPMFAAPKAMSEADVAVVEREEGWVLGV